MSASVLSQIQGLKGLTAQGLKLRWRELMGSEPPAFNRTYLEQRLGYRIQELAFGGLGADARERLAALATQQDKAKASSRNRRIEERPVVGTKLIREWRGIEHQVTVHGDYYEYEGRPYKSLSAAARAITGTQWNGLAFFGLKRASADPKAGRGR